ERTRSRNQGAGLVRVGLGLDVRREAAAVVAEVVPVLEELGEVVLVEAQRDRGRFGVEEGLPAPAHPGLAGLVPPAPVRDAPDVAARGVVDRQRRLRQLLPGPALFRVTDP